MDKQRILLFHLEDLLVYHHKKPLSHYTSPLLLLIILINADLRFSQLQICSNCHYGNVNMHTVVLLLQERASSILASASSAHVVRQPQSHTLTRAHDDIHLAVEAAGGSPLNLNNKTRCHLFKH